MSSPQITWDDEATKTPQVQWDAPKKPVSTQSVPPKSPGIIDSVNSSLAYKPSDGMMMKGLKTAGQLIAGPTTEIATTIGGIGDAIKSTQIGENAPNDEYAVGKMTSLPGTDTSLGLPVYKAVKGIAGQAKDSLVAGYNAAKSGEGLPGVALSEYEKLPLVGDLVQKMEHGQGVGAVAQGVTRAALMKGATKVPEIPNIAKAEGDPGVLYHKYLDPIKDTNIALPDLTPRVRAALIKKVEINSPAIAARMEGGSTTIGDLDIIRQVANDSAKAAYTPKGIPTQMARGFANAGDAMRNVIYPKIEQAHGLPSGTIASIKGVHGDILSMGKPPAVGHFPSRWPAVATDRLAYRPAIAGVNNVRTRLIGSSLPPPKP